MYNDKAIFEDYLKVSAIIKSCLTYEQLRVAINCSEVFLRKWDCKQKYHPKWASVLMLIFNDKYFHKQLYNELLNKISFQQYSVYGKVFDRSSAEMQGS